MYVFFYYFIFFMYLMYFFTYVDFIYLKYLRHMTYIKVLPSLIYIRREQETENCTLPLPMQMVLGIKDQMEIFVEEHLQVAKIWVSYTTFRQMKKLTNIL